MSSEIKIMDSSVGRNVSSQEMYRLGPINITQSGVQRGFCRHGTFSPIPSHTFLSKICQVTYFHCYDLTTCQECKLFGSRLIEVGEKICEGDMSSS